MLLLVRPTRPPATKRSLRDRGTTPERDPCSLCQLSPGREPNRRDQYDRAVARWRGETAWPYHGIRDVVEVR